MTIEDRIRVCAHRVADEVQPSPVPDLELVTRRAQVGRSRLQVVSVAVAAAGMVAAALVGTRLLEPQDTDTFQPATVTASSPRSGPVWFDSKGLHLGEDVMDTAVSQFASCPDNDLTCSPFTSLALLRDGVVYGDRESLEVWYQAWNDEPQLIGTGSRHGPAADPDGTTAAWFSGTELVMFDTATGEEVARSQQAVLPTPQRENAFGNSIFDVDSDGVSWSMCGGFHFDRASGVTTNNQPRGKDVRGCGNGDVHADLVVTVDSRGTRVSSTTGETPVAFEPDAIEYLTRFSPSGRYLAGLNGWAVVVADLHTGELWRPSQQYYPWIGWGYGDTLMVIEDRMDPKDGQEPTGHHLLACDVSDQSCTELDHTGPITLPGG